PAVRSAAAGYGGQRRLNAPSGSAPEHGDAGATSTAQVALFDLDGTLTRRDTLTQYVAGFLRRHPWRALRLPLAFPALLRFVLGRSDRGRLKASLLRSVLGDLTRADLESWTQAFVARVAERGVFQEARDALTRHRERGDTLALLSASPDLYVPALGAALGIADVTCTGLAWRDERLSGGLTTPNRRGMEKVRCLEALRQRYPGRAVVAYGNAASDLPHLGLADTGVLVNGDRRARAAAAGLNISTVSWR
ncbi:MAG TPA: HAD-IB family hydrolase, partial [Candidatus Dormibacteraeota bacterium]|nr:HAD-IB family hydrolase [Candidatus Dormibacteraeota bacterium]